MGGKHRSVAERIRALERKAMMIKMQADPTYKAMRRAESALRKVEDDDHAKAALEAIQTYYSSIGLK